VDKIAAVILAAGCSSRLGQAKQLVEFEGKTLLERAIDAAARVKCEPIIVIVGAHAEQIAMRVDQSRAQFVENADREKGIGSSIRAGILQLQKTEPAASAVLLMLSDQPFVGESQLSRLVHARQKTRNPIVCSQYSETVGVPAIFGREFFDELMQLGKAGAKELLLAHSNQCAHVLMPEAERDIDTAAALDTLRDGG
jgi:molybdenum cofactor cytidylyltransferase